MTPESVAALHVLAKEVRKSSAAAGVAIAVTTHGRLRCCMRDGDMAPDIGVEIGDSGVARQAIRSGKVIVVADTDSDPRVNRSASDVLHARSMVFVPLHSAEGRDVLLSVFSPEPDAFDLRSVDLLRDRAARIFRITCELDKAASPSATTSVSPSVMTSPAVRDTRKGRWIVALGGTAVLVLSTFLVVGEARHLEISRSQSAALEALRTNALSGDSQAEYQLGLKYVRGDGIERNEREGAAWLRRSAESGDARAQSAFADLLAGGRGVTQDLPQAAAWYTISSLNENSVARASLESLLHQLSPAEIAESRYDVGTMFEAGLGVERDYVAAYSWFMLADSDEQRAQSALARIRSLMTPEQLKEARSKTAAARAQASSLLPEALERRSP